MDLSIVHVWIHVPHLDLVEMCSQRLEMNLRCDRRRKNSNPLTLRAKNQNPKKQKFSIYEKTVNRRTSRKVAFGS